VTNLPDELSIEDQLHLLLGRLVHAHARFDFNLGLQLKWIGPCLGVAVDHLLNPRAPFSQRLAALEPLVVEVYCEAGADAPADFEHWFDRAREAKALRNDHAHGRWGFRSASMLGDFDVEFVRLNWETDPLKQEGAVRLKLEDFAKEVAAIESLFGDYARLERRFRHRARPPKRPETGGRDA